MKPRTLGDAIAVIAALWVIYRHGGPTVAWIAGHDDLSVAELVALAAEWTAYEPHSRDIAVPRLIDNREIEADSTEDAP